MKDDVHVLVAVLHHIISDGWSMGILFKEIGENYAAYVQGISVVPPDLAIQYADFTVWQREKYSTDFLNEQFSFWNDKLGGELPILDLPIDNSRPSTQSILGNFKTFHLPSDLTLRLKRLAAKEGVTLFTLLLAAFKIFLHRMTNQDDIIVGTPVAGRNQADLEGVIGFFANTLAIRSSISKSDTFLKFLHELKNSTVEALEHQDLPFEMLVDRLQTQRDMSYPPVFQVMFVMQNAPMPDQELPHLTLSAVDIHTGTSKFDLTLIIGEDEGITTGIFEYTKVLFNPKTIDNFVDIYLTLLHSIVTDPAKEISNLNLISIETRNNLLLDAARNIPVKETLDLIFQRTAERSWEREALGKGGERMTYGELEEKSNQIGRWLRKQGVNGGDLVVLRLGRTMGMVAAVLGVLKAGGAYVPLELSNPEERAGAHPERSKSSDGRERTAGTDR